jgi:hypothetical protein
MNALFFAAKMCAEKGSEYEILNILLLAVLI